MICTGNFKTLAQTLAKFGLVVGEDFSVCPFLFDRTKKDKVLEAKHKLLVSSPEHMFAEDGRGGGVYELSTSDGSVRKVYTGKCRSIVKMEEGYAVLDMLRGIILLGHNFEELKCIPLAKNSEPHGLAYCSERKVFACGLPGVDGVGIYDAKNGSEIDFYPISAKAQVEGRDNHHVNDLCFFNDSLIVSMFSLSGNWDKELYDGGLMELNLTSGCWYSPLVDHLWMPHSVKQFSESLIFLDSMRGALHQGTNTQLFKFPAFLRGLDISKDGLFGIGVSEHRYPEKVPAEMKCTFVSSGVLLVDAESNSTRFFDLDVTSSIHDVVFQ